MNRSSVREIENKKKEKTKNNKGVGGSRYIRFVRHENYDELLVDSADIKNVNEEI